ncbi:UDP-glucuronosyltransferase 1A1-like [Pyxicephalus adspersus]|uniref:UDP-glucuronosyltransferase 1A1-like n=1 Tax=Pyxicephalus adspersus TaxID=30357 RepID=UPI003B5C6742
MSDRKLLVVPQDGSHWLSMRSVVQKLFDRGHEIVVVVPEISLQFKNLDQFTVRTFSVPYPEEYIESLIKDYTKEVFEERTTVQNAVLMYDRLMNMTKFYIAGLMDLETRKFDAMLIDPVFPCGVILAKHLSIPSVFFLRGVLFRMVQEATQVPSALSYVP